MKNHIISTIIAAFVCLATQAGAIQLSDLEGTWKGKRTEIRAGVGGYSSATIIGKRGSDGGIVINEIGTSKWIGSYKIKHTFKKDGGYRAIQTYYGLILSTSSGSWRRSGDTISISGVGKNSNGSSRFSGSLKMTSPTKIVYSGKSGTTSVKISATRQ